MLSAASVVFALYLAQAAGALVLALVLLRFARTYHRRYLMDWSAGWGAWVLYQLGAGFAFLLAVRGGAGGWGTLLSATSLVAGNAQAAFLLFGSVELARARPVKPGIRTFSLAAAVLLGV